MIQLAVSIYIICAVVYSLIKGVNQPLLTLILVITGGNVLLTEILVRQGTSFTMNTNLYFILNNSLWLLLILNKFHQRTKSVTVFFLMGLVLYTLLNHNIQEIRFYTFFVITSVLYILLFLIICVRHLSDDKLDFFLSRELLLLFSPILFFLGMSFIFAFKSAVFSNTYLFHKVNIYTFINIIVNLVYYFLIGYYAYRTSRK